MTKKVEKKEKSKEKEVKTIKLYEAIFFGIALLLLIFVILVKYVTPNI